MNAPEMPWTTGSVQPGPSGWRAAPLPVAVSWKPIGPWT
jgi:hypothetical protein